MNLLFYLLLTLSIVGLDQYTKKLVTLIITDGKEITVINNFLRFVNVKNYGAAFSILQNQRIILIAIPIVFIIFCTVMIIKDRDKSKLLLISLTFILSGAIGNLIDRIKLSYVVDFIDINFGSYHYPSFNIADSFVTIGAILLMIFLIFFDKKKKKNEDNKTSN